MPITIKKDGKIIYKGNNLYATEHILTEHTGYDKKTFRPIIKIPHK